MQLGAFFPFSRNHNAIDAKDQEPYALGDDVRITSIVSLKQRYSLLKWYYSKFAELNGTGTVFRPLMW
jgi:alpha-glucosidase (family GH31 glycosyl hydrolase)